MDLSTHSVIPITLPSTAAYLVCKCYFPKTPQVSVKVSSVVMLVAIKAVISDVLRNSSSPLLIWRLSRIEKEKSATAAIGKSAAVSIKSGCWNS